MLDPQDQALFDGLVNRLRDDDPRFCRRVDRLARPRRRLRSAVAILLWTMAPFSIVFGGWTGLILATVGAAYGARLWAKRNGTQPQPQWWTATRGRRPGPAPSV